MIDEPSTIDRTSSCLINSLKLGFDAKRAFLNKTGLGNYSRSAIRVLASYFPQNEYYLYTPKISTENGFSFYQDLSNTKILLPKAKVFKSFWRSKGIVKDLKRDRIDLYHGLSQELPIGTKKNGIKTVVTIHDLIYLKYPQYFGSVNRKVYEWKARYGCENANQIIAVSMQTKADIIQYFGVPPQKITVVYQGCDAAFRVPQNDAVKEAIRLKYKLPAKFILNVGTIETRKNLLVIIKALKSIEEEIKLVVVGRETDYAAQIKNYMIKEALQNRVLFLSDVSFKDLPAIYQLAKVFTYPSRYEGFGIPIVEALCSGTPVVAATGSCLEEAGGPQSIYVDPDDDASFAVEINKILEDDQLQAKIKTAGIQYAERFADWHIAQNLMAVYQQVLQNA